MKKKVIGVLICMLLIAVSISSVTGIIDENEIYNMKTDDYDTLIKQAIENGVISNNDWWEQDKLLASDGAAYDYFGVSVSIDGDYAIVGADRDDDNGRGFGSAYIFKRDGTSWTQQAKLLASDGAAYDFFGLSVSIDGDYAIVGAWGDDDNGDMSGSAYIFTRSGTAWTEEAKLLASDGAADDSFGVSVSISGDYAVIGAPLNVGWSGSAYIFTRSGTAWTEQAKLLASDGAADDHFGGSVSIDGDYAIIGARYDDDNGVDSGSAYIFTRSGTAWTEQAKLLPSDGAANDMFGSLRSVSIDGDYAIIGAPYDDDNGVDSGSAYVFKRCVPGLSFIIKGGLGARIVITNNATEDINDVEWEVQVEGGILGMINKTAFGTIDVSAEDSVTVGTGLLFGLGSIDIKATVAGEEKTATGTQIIIFTLV